jgi:Transposase DDE domain
VLNSRLRGKKEVAKKNGRTLKKDIKKWLKFTFFVTNVPKEIWEPRFVGSVYQLRWSIELVFKNWKSLLNIDIMKGKSVYRIECFILGRLIAVLLLTFYISWIRTFVDCTYGRELSTYKFTQWMLRNERMLLIAQPEMLERELTGILSGTILALCKDKRMRLTSEEIVFDSYSYDELHPQYTANEGVRSVA